ncbi:hypothetical protein CFP56_021615 [Quercus suber]|uniref:Uncharacterized protein n=1 Tax=Quercus suber TaxID=58331 RepID=A0AAW0M0L8_QUESU
MGFYHHAVYSQGIHVLVLSLTQLPNNGIQLLLVRISFLVK